jgi:predicted nucleotide-binding protein
VTVDPTLLEKLEVKLDLGTRQVNRLISERARTLLVSREDAAVALALESKVSVPRRLLTPDVLTTIRTAGGSSSNPPPPTTPPLARRTTRKKAARRATTKKRSVPRKNRKKVFVVHGRDEARRKSMFRLLRAMKLEPIQWSEAVSATGKAAPYIGEVLDKAFLDAAAVVVLLTPDDQARLKSTLRKLKDPKYESTLTGQARANVLFEAGMAFGHHQESTVLVQVGDLRPFSDIGGRHVVNLDNTALTRRDLANRLQTAGCDVNLDGSDWLTEGDFD